MLNTMKSIFERIFDCRIYRGWYPRGTNLAFDLKRLITNADATIFDVGANVGETAIGLATQFPTSTIIAFEPVLATFELLRNNTKGLKNVHVHPVALGSVTEQAEMHLYPGTVNNTLVAPDAPGSELCKELVQVQRLDHFCLKEKIQAIDFLKIDTEGFDLEVIRGADQILREKRIKLVLAELGFSSSNRKHVPFHQFHALLNDYGFELFGSMNSNANPMLTTN